VRGSCEWSKQTVRDARYTPEASRMVAGWCERSRASTGQRPFLSNQNPFRQIIILFCRNQNSFLQIIILF